jgi:hypothetical protein
MRNPPFRPPLRVASVGAGSKRARYGVLMLLEMCIAHIFCPPMNLCRGGAGLIQPAGLARPQIGLQPAGGAQRWNAPARQGSTYLRTAINAQSPSARRHAGGDARAPRTCVLRHTRAGTPAPPGRACYAARGRGRPRPQDVRATPHAGGDARAPRTCVVQSCCPTISRLTLHQPAPSPISAIRTPHTPPFSPCGRRGAGGDEGATAHPPALPPPSSACGSRGAGGERKRASGRPTLPPRPRAGEGGQGVRVNGSRGV